jgi:hypothetical protein
VRTGKQSACIVTDAGLTAIQVEGEGGTPEERAGLITFRSVQHLLDGPQSHERVMQPEKAVGGICRWDDRRGRRFSDGRCTSHGYLSVTRIDVAPRYQSRVGMTLERPAFHGSHGTTMSNADAALLQRESNVPRLR